MLSQENIKAIITSGEGYNAEFKVRLPNKLRELTEEICAFANSAGGVLILGVNDDNEVIGISLDNAKRSSLQNSLNEINPNIYCGLYSVEVDGKELWVIEVNTGAQKPYVLSGAIFVRQGSNTQKLTTVDQMRDFFQQSGRIYFDEAPCSEFDVNMDIDQSFFEEFKHLANLSASVSQGQIIANLRLLVENKSFKNGGVLFFGSAPQDFIEKAVVRCVAFEGTTKTQIIDDKVYGGPLVVQYEEAMRWLKQKLDVKYIIVGAGPREEVLEIPETALKETLINALTHRDYYDKGARITVELFSDRLEISNPGGLVSAIKPEDFGIKSHSRNPLIFGLFERIQMVEQIGSGIGRIKGALKEANMTEPIFHMDGFFTVVFKRGGLKIKLSVNEQAILNLIKLFPNITISEMAIQVGISTTAIDNNLKKLKRKNIINRIGFEHGGRWEIIDLG